jgi:hypothetical protein
MEFTPPEPRADTRGAMFGNRGIDRPLAGIVGDERAIVSSMINRFYATLHGLAAVPKNNFVLIDTRNTLAWVAGVQNGCANELHPYPAGFILLAQKWLALLQGQFPGSI